MKSPSFDKRETSGLPYISQVLSFSALKNRRMTINSDITQIQSPIFIQS